MINWNKYHDVKILTKGGIFVFSHRLILSQVKEVDAILSVSGFSPLSLDGGKVVLDYSQYCTESVCAILDSLDIRESKGVKNPFKSFTPEELADYAKLHYRWFNLPGERKIFPHAFFHTKNDVNVFDFLEFYEIDYLLKQSISSYLETKEDTTILFTQRAFRKLIFEEFESGNDQNTSPWNPKESVSDLIKAKGIDWTIDFFGEEFAKYFMGDVYNGDNLNYAVFALQNNKKIWTMEIPVFQIEDLDYWNENPIEMFLYMQQSNPFLAKILSHDSWMGKYHRLVDLSYILLSNDHSLLFSIVLNAPRDKKFNIPEVNKNGVSFFHRIIPKMAKLYLQGQNETTQSDTNLSQRFRAPDFREKVELEIISTDFSTHILPSTLPAITLPELSSLIQYSVCDSNSK